MKISWEQQSFIKLLGAHINLKTNSQTNELHSFKSFSQQKRSRNEPSTGIVEELPKLTKYYYVIRVPHTRFLFSHSAGGDFEILGTRFMFVLRRCWQPTSVRDTLLLRNCDGTWEIPCKGLDKCHYYFNAKIRPKWTWIPPSPILLFL